MESLKVLSGLIAIVVAATLSAIFSGYALSVLWGWFVVPTFQAPQLSVVAAIGIATVVSYLTHQETHEPKNEYRSFSDKVFQACGQAIGKPGFALLFGWVVHLFM